MNDPWSVFWTKLPEILQALAMVAGAMGTIYTAFLGRRIVAKQAVTATKLDVIHDDVNGKTIAATAAALVSAQREQASAIAAAVATTSLAAANPTRPPDPSPARPEFPPPGTD